MSRSLKPSDAAAYIAAGDIDIVDVRNPDEFARGHIPGARNVPLDDFKAEPKAKLPRDKILFVCARGIRSQSAAELAVQIGFSDVANLEVDRARR
jgi:rhodanese-related sulfurtransferase